MHSSARWFLRSPIPPSLQNDLPHSNWLIDSHSPISSAGALQQQPADEDDEHRARRILSKQQNASEGYFEPGIDSLMATGIGLGRRGGSLFLISVHSVVVC